MRGHVRKRGSRWGFIIELDRDPVTGARRQKWVSGFKTKVEAERELRARLKALDDGDDAFPSAITVRDFVNERWLPHLETQGRLRPGTIRNYRQIARDRVLPRLGAMELRKVRPADVQLVLDAMSEAGKAPRTVAHARAAMSALLMTDPAAADRIWNAYADLPAGLSIVTFASPQHSTPTHHRNNPGCSSSSQSSLGS